MLEPGQATLDKLGYLINSSPKFYRVTQKVHDYNTTFDHGHLGVAIIAELYKTKK